MDERKRYEEGLAMRRAVHGDAYVDRSLQNRNEFNEDFQELLTRHVWGELWTRPELPQQTRLLITLSMIVALNRMDEFRLYVRSALHCGVTREQIREMLLHAAIYYGMPAANSAFHAAEEVFLQLSREAR